MEPVQRRIARNLQRIRKSRGLSLDKVAELTGVSKAMLGQIERGESNPTVTTLWKIANGLNVSFSSFVEEDPAPVSVVSTKEVEPLVKNAGKYKVYPLFPFDPKKRFEMYTVELAPGCSHASEAHPGGVEEYLIVSQGNIEVEIDGHTYELQQGAAIRFPADRPHIYRNHTDESSLVQLLLYYG